MSARLQAALACRQIIDHGSGLDKALGKASAELDSRDKSMTQAIVYGVVRHLVSLDRLAQTLLNKPFRNKDRDIHFVLLSALYQLLAMRAPVHAVVNDSVDAARQLKKQWARGVINACLRSFLRDSASKSETWIDPQAEHPDWLKQKISEQWPEQAAVVLEENLSPPEMTLRVNTLRQSRTEYLKTLTEKSIEATEHPWTEQAIVLKTPVAVDSLPGFDQGAASVQDAAAQMAATTLMPEAGEHILDACAAPGGKTTHLLELAGADLSLTAADVDAQRLTKVNENLERLNLSASLLEADLTDQHDWWDGQAFDRILLDAPCSSTGVIRRHPDILRHLREQDIDVLQRKQLALLNALWPKLKPGGWLLYATCSILAEENDQVVEQFLDGPAKAEAGKPGHPWAQTTRFGYQTLPRANVGDGFYTCLLTKPLAG